MTPQERWEEQEHQRRVTRLGEFLAEDWRQVVAEHALPDGYLPQWAVLQLMEDAYGMGEGKGRREATASSSPPALVGGAYEGTTGAERR